MIADASCAKEYFTAAEIAAMRLPGLPTTPRGVLRFAKSNGWCRPRVCRRHKGQGGGIEFHWSLFPDPSRTAFIATAGLNPAARLPADDDEPQDARPASTDHAALWAWFERQTEAGRAEGKRRLDALLRIEAIRRSKIGRAAAIETVAREFDVGVSTLHEWRDRVRGVARPDWMAALTPQARGGARVKIVVDEQVWNAFKTDYLRLSQPSFESAYRRTERIARQEGWTMPPSRTLRRRVAALDPAMVVLARKGSDALKRMYPAQERDRSGFHAMQAVNADGHKWDVFVRWEDGSIGRPMTMAWQDLLSGKFVAWRTAKSENRDTVRLAFGDMITKFGIPDQAYMDNGRAFASKWLTGGIPNRYRFKVKAEDPVGIMTQLGVEIHWTTPYAGQSKPIERGFRDFATDIAKHPAFEGAYTGNSPMAKPENYGSAAVPIDEFMRIIDGEIAAHNARLGRESGVCKGKFSFDQVFGESYATALIRRATPEQARLCLLAAESVLVRELDGSIHLFGNRYWDEALWAHRGERVTVRFDPDNLHGDLLVSAMDGTPICAAPAIETVGFGDTAKARTHNQARNTLMKAKKDLAKAEKVLSLADLAALQPKYEPAPEPTPSPIARPLFGTRGALALNIETFERPDQSAREARDALFDEKLRRSVERLRIVSDGP